MLPKNDAEGRILVMGIGNYLMGDEGVGVHLAKRLADVHLAKRLAEINLPSLVDVVDGGTGGFHLLGYFEKYRQVILIDATLDDNPVGTFRLVKPKFASDFPKAMSTHDIGLKGMVSALQLLGKSPEIYLLIVSIESIQQQSIELTKEIEAIMPRLFEKVTELIGVIMEKTPEMILI
jgi:hydrogenase maturation protease